MRKAPLIIVFLAAFSLTAAAENIVIVQGSYLSSGADYEFESAGGEKQEVAGSFTAWGPTVTGHFGIGGDVGVLTSLGAYLPTWVFATEPRKGDSAIDDGGLFIAGDVGVGWHVDVPDSPLSFVLGAGVHLISRTLYPPEDSDADDASETVFGLSAQALPMVGVGDGVYMTAGLKLAYHFLHVDSEPELPDNYDYTGGLALSVSLGYGFRF